MISLAPDVVSLLALLISALAAHYAWRMAKNDTARRIEERRPAWVAELVRHGGNRTVGGLILHLVSKEPLDHVRVVSSDMSLLLFAGDQDGSPAVGPEAESVRQVQPGATGSGRTGWRVQIPDPSPGGRVRLKITARRRRESWEDWVDVALPSPDAIN